MPPHGGKPGLTPYAPTALANPAYVRALGQVTLTFAYPARDCGSKLVKSTARQARGERFAVQSCTVDITYST